MQPTEKQISFALSLLARSGYSIINMNAKFKELGATMNERKGKVIDWLRSMNKAEISALIDKLIDNKLK